MQTFQVFKNVFSNAVIADLTLPQIAENIQAGGGLYGIPSYKQDIFLLRTTTDLDLKDEIKRRLPTFAASVYYPNKSKAEGEKKIVRNWMVLDVDSKENPNVIDKIDIIRSAANASMVFISPKGDGVKIVYPVNFRNENDYYEAFIQITDKLNEVLSQRNMKPLIYDLSAAKYTQTCLFSFDKETEFYSDIAEQNPNYTGSPTTKRVSNSVLTDADWASVDTTSVANLFASTIDKLALKGVIWGKGTDNFLMEIVKLKNYGISREQLVNLVHEHANNKYSRKHKKTTVTNKLSRLFLNLFNKNVSKPTVIPTVGPIQFSNYLTEHIDLIWDRLKQQRTIYLDAPTGAGKTSVIKQLQAISGLQIDLLCPTTALAQQQQGEGVLNITGDGMLQAEHLAIPILACCFESIAKARKRQAEILVIDEAHELVSAYGYRSKGIQAISEYTSAYKYVVYLSGSMFPLAPHVSKLMRFERVNKKVQPYDLVTLGKNEKDADYFASTIKADSLNVFYKNDKTQLKALKLFLEGKGYKVLLATADEKENEGYVKMIQDETLKDYDILLTTCLLQSGVNVTDNRAVHIVYGVGCSVLDYIQFTARFRNIIPSIEIIHSGEVKALLWYSVGTEKDKLNLLANSYNQIKELNKNKIMNQKSFAEPSNIDGLRMNRKGEYEADPYYIKFKEYEILNKNAASNKLALEIELVKFGFVLNKHVIMSTPDLIKESSERVKSLAADKKLAIATALVEGSFTLSKKPSKEERDLQQKFNRLTQLEINNITANMILKQTDYKRTCNRALWELLSYNDANGFVINPKASDWFTKRKQLQQLVKVGKVPAKQLQQLVTSVIGFDFNQQINEVLGIYFDIKRSKVQVNKNREYEYDIQPYILGDVTRTASACNLTDADIDWFLTE